jgi:hypothetical protein
VVRVIALVLSNLTQTARLCFLCINRRAACATNLRSLLRGDLFQRKGAKHRKGTQSVRVDRLQDSITNEKIDCPKPLRFFANLRTFALKTAWQNEFANVVTRTHPNSTAPKRCLPSLLVGRSMMRCASERRPVLLATEVGSESSRTRLRFWFRSKSKYRVRPIVSNDYRIEPAGH